jgi:hypothetical protein
MKLLSTFSRLIATIALFLFFLPQQLIAQVEPIDLKLPRPMFVGTPSNFAVDKLEEPLGHPRPPFLAPVGTKNVALGKPVTASYQPRIGELHQITDGYKEAVENSYVELGAGHQYVTIDLEDTYTIYAIALWHYHMSARVYNNVVVQVSDDPDFIFDVETIFNNDMNNNLGLGIGEDYNYVETHEGKLIDARGLNGRYVRLHSNGNTHNNLNHYIEVEVYGIPVN